MSTRRRARSTSRSRSVSSIPTSTTTSRSILLALRRRPRTSEPPASLLDFTARIRDGDNQAPTLVQLFLSQDGGVTWDSGHSLVPAENSTNYTVGVLYHLAQRIQLAASAPTPYMYRFEANDGNEPTNTILTHVGTGPTPTDPFRSV